MSRPLNSRDEVAGLIGAVCNEAATPEQVRRLEALILADPAVEARFVQAMSLYGGLISHFAAAPVVSAGGVAPGRTRWGFGRRTRYLLAAATALVAIAIGRPDRLLDGIGGQGPGKKVAAVATVTRSVGAEWDDGGLPVRLGTPVGPRLLKLKSGLAQVEFHGGAAVVMEGPAELRVVSAAEAVCDRGKLRVLVPPRAGAFRVRTPVIEAVDRGAEFALRVGLDVDVHVIRGAVELYEPDTATVREVKAGQGERWGRHASPSPIAASPADFVSVPELAAQFEADMARRYSRWQTAARALEYDPALLVYYPFDGELSWDRTLVNRSPAGAEGDGAVTGAAWCDGRWPGKKRGLEFRESGDRVRFQLTGEYESVTLAVWVAVDRLGRPFNALMLTDRWGPGAVHWQIRANGSVALGVHGTPGTNGWELSRSDYVTSPVIGPSQLGRWVHLAAVYDGRARTIAHYVDGRPVSAEPLRYDTLIRFDNAELGNWAVDSPADRPFGRTLDGRMDEFVAFSRPLAATEVTRLYQDGAPGH